MLLIPGRKPKAQDHLPAQILIDDDQERRGPLPSDMTLARELADLLLAHYPGHPWIVQVDSKQGVAVIKHPFITGPHIGYVIHLRNLHADPKRRLAIRGGGEILERWNVPRGGMNMADIVAATLSFNDKILPGAAKKPGLVF